MADKGADKNTLGMDNLPTTFWEPHQSVISDTNLRFLHAEMCARLRGESPGADTLELMAIERIATLYFLMRVKERRGQSGDAPYRVYFQSWVTMASELRKHRSGSESLTKAREEVFRTVINAVNGALGEIDPPVAKKIRQRLSENLEKV